MLCRTDFEECKAEKGLMSDGGFRQATVTDQLMHAENEWHNPLKIGTRTSVLKRFC